MIFLTGIAVKIIIVVTINRFITTTTTSIKPNRCIIIVVTINTFITTTTTLIKANRCIILVVNPNAAKTPIVNANRATIMTILNMNFVMTIVSNTNIVY